ncbi:PREDICTED: uncharacterized protein LOC108762856 [Trachymyrmex cornetzi]|uniref:uncharacterized protein LOC108762856 n=1 Tax=Trachymyrmex cornetzi TaxID=471704 RepID=UPI00084F1336|nr:PREDICTED: uncharacterized protein LOC108762856 [Trachymyrmex cornetzi]
MCFREVMQSIRLVVLERKVLIMQSGIRQSVGLASRDTALLKGDWKLESTCEVALVAAFLYPTMLKNPSFQTFWICSHLCGRIFAACNGRKPRKIAESVSNYFKEVMKLPCYLAPVNLPETA